MKLIFPANWKRKLDIRSSIFFMKTKEDGIDISVLGFHGPSPTWKLVSGNLKGSGQKWSNNPEVTLSGDGHRSW